jgi:hypothetical protein
VLPRNVVLAAAALLGALAAVGSATASSPEETLALRYAPVVRVATDVYGCEHADPFVPTDVNVIFGNDEVVLRGPWDRTNVIKVAPLAGDLTARRVDYHLDFPGNALDPGCTYVEWSKRLNAAAPPTVYAHVMTDPEYPGKLALQYWFFYVFNDFNNKHEGDWEMIQLDFDATTAREGLERQPVEVGYSQHEGAERAAWTDRKLVRVDGTHPVVYPAAGSHANFYSQGLFLGRSAAQGVGCDDTSGPYQSLRPRVAVVPETTDAYLSEYPWLAFTGRWGELQPAFYNGPTGPNMKTQWTAPITWTQTWRDRSFEVPGGQSIGPQATQFFCGAVAAGSAVLTKAIRNPQATLVTLGVILALLVFAATRTSWSGSAPLRLRRRRAFGEIVVSAWQLYRAHARTFIGIGVLFVPIGVVITLLQYLLFRVVGLVPLVETAGASNVSVAGLAFSLGLIFTVFALAVVQAAAAIVMRATDDGVDLNARRAYREAAQSLRPLLWAVVRAAAVVVILDLSVVGIPVAIWLLVRWSLLAQVVVLEPGGAEAPLRRSAAFVSGRWWRVALFTLVVSGVGLFLGPFVGGLMLLATTASFNVVNLVASLIYTVTMPFVAIATTYLYFDLSTRSELAARVPRVRELPAEV